MSMTVEEIAAVVQELSVAEREALCAQIAESLDVPLSVEEQAWADLADRRAGELRSGGVLGVPATEAFAKARQRLGL